MASSSAVQTTRMSAGAAAGLDDMARAGRRRRARRGRAQPAGAAK